MLLLTLLLACNDAGDPATTPTDTDIPPDATTCAGGAARVDHELVTLGYLSSGGPEKEVFTEAADWEAFVASLSDTGNYAYTDGAPPEVDLATHVVFTRFWVDGGCTDAPTYAACVADGHLEMRVRLGKDGGCDAFFPQLDLIIVPRGGATTFAWQ